MKEFLECMVCCHMDLSPENLFYRNCIQKQETHNLKSHSQIIHCSCFLVKNNNNHNNNKQSFRKLGPRVTVWRGGRAPLRGGASGEAIGSSRGSQCFSRESVSLLILARFPELASSPPLRLPAWSPLTGCSPPYCDTVGHHRGAPVPFPPTILQDGEARDL
jgi:hypothetical protein